MTFCRIAAPVDDKIGSVFDFAQRASDFATQLGSDFGRTVSQRCVAIQQTTQLVSQRHTFFLGFARRVAHAVDQRHVRIVKVICGRFDRVVQRGFFAVDQCVGVFFVCGVIQKPSLAQHASFDGFVNPISIGMQLNIIAYATTKSTRGVVDYF